MFAELERKVLSNKSMKNIKTEKVERKLSILRSPNCPIHWEAQFGSTGVALNTARCPNSTDQVE